MMPTTAREMTTKKATKLIFSVGSIIILRTHSPLTFYRAVVGGGMISRLELGIIGLHVNWTNDGSSIFLGNFIIRVSK